MPRTDRLFAAAPPEAVTEAGLALERVEQVLRLEVHSVVETVRSVGLLTLDGGGKRFRPALTFLAAMAVDPSTGTGRLDQIGACMEMVHMATLVHDDVIDQSPMRRGRETAAHRFGNTAAVLSGDVLLAKAMRLLARDGDLAVIRAVSDMVVEMAEGEVREVEARGRFDLSAEEHLAVVRMKTAAFVECCCLVGGMVAGADLTALQALRDFGHNVGMAFQIADDLLDYDGDESRAGKPLGIDFREGQATLPLIDLRNSLEADESDFVASKFGNGVTEAELEVIRGWMRDRGSIQRATDAAQTHVDQAKASLAVLPQSPYRAVLDSLAQFSVHREA